MTARLLSWIRRLLRRLALWLGRLGEEPRPRVERLAALGRPDPVEEAADAPSAAPEHWLRRASPPPPAHWLARARGARPLPSIPDPASPSPVPAGEDPRTVAPAPQGRRADPALAAPPRRSSPESPGAGKGGASPPLPLPASRPDPGARPFPAAPRRSDAARPRVVTRIEEVVAPAKRAPEAPRPADMRPRRDPPPPPARPARRPFVSLDDVAPPARLRVDPPTLILPSPALETRPAAPPAPRPRPMAAALPEPARAATRAALDVEAPSLAAAFALDPTAEGAAAWPDLPRRDGDDDEPWRQERRDAERRRRLDLEQRGMPWSG